MAKAAVLLAACLSLQAEGSVLAKLLFGQAASLASLWTRLQKVLFSALLWMCKVVHIPGGLWEELCCVAHHSSSFKPCHRTDEYYGVFQLSNRQHCEDPKYKGKNQCNMVCENLLNLDFDDDVKCAFHILKINGIGTWKHLATKCQHGDLRSYIRGCHTGCQETNDKLQFNGLLCENEMSL
uniref:lysozyme n=1 Tax=Pyxicephalus adspersus TaxID=30357 RepID=A0AAV3AGH2_PYXAD|nr:TPA: hypothetical protein GDO54_013314 [Pyxicephalus adspersus]